ncbi:hypothetical protein PSN45_001974 [Yamadazyma tenuis]|uniref:Major facilitator superfamily (MFS) profile domain-containing protein n=1 Tax=Candida tenuis (strain ATCC 10573 / BCRC 21748 / CBS 615 / JCM 9827 / NBRC 10315 / NRRL Y-1498 / VKM Y-70) TaxID=590646 RepID=G3BD90_CANTC|nr:uncharacterized protein CANTEDRAFT_111872 [Yamadazyma tenuis ATCC 10573]EGV61076.1 hypothetical protein CANTEDRAFT_111872 [Yamadazyma tenuis ATCC 10573]WEJ94488.1 hypothetical protein PSN45_001974 [Yamadazyma tenuis]
MSASSIDKQPHYTEDAPINLEDDRVENYIKQDLKWWKQSHLIKLNFLLFLCTLASTNNGYDGSMLNGLQSLESWNKKINPSGDSVKLGALSNGTIFGSIIGLPIVPYIVDRWGRRVGIFSGQLLCLIGAILQGVSTNYAFFLSARMVLGLGNAFMVVSAPALISEIAFPSHREAATGFYNTCWYLGAFLAAWITYGTNKLGTENNWAWRIPSFLQGFMPLVQVLTIFFVPESPRFHVSKGQFDKAEAMLRKHHIGGSNDPMDLALIDFEMKEIQLAIELEKLNTESSYWDFIKLKNFRKRTFLVFYTPCIMQLSGNGLVSYYLNKVLNSIGITDSDRQLQINGFLMMYNMFLSMGVAFVFKYFKRRKMFLFSIASMLICYILWTILSALAVKRHYPTSLSNGVLAFIFLFYASYDIGLNGLPILYITEILPYTHRAKGLNLFQFGQTCTLIFNGYVNPVAMDAIEWKYYIVWCCNLAVELVVVYFFYPETNLHKDTTLEEIGQIFGDPISDSRLMSISHEEKLEVEHSA